MEKFNLKRRALQASIGATVVTSFLFTTLAVSLAIPASLSRKLIDYQVNALNGVEDDTGEWMFTHPVDLMWSLWDVVRPRKKSGLKEEFGESDPSDMVPPVNPEEGKNLDELDNSKPADVNEAA